MSKIPEQKPNKTEYITFNEIIDYWGKNPANLRMIVAFIENTKSKENLAKRIGDEYNIDKKYLQIPFFSKPETERQIFLGNPKEDVRLINTLNYVNNILKAEQQAKMKPDFLIPPTETSIVRKESFRATESRTRKNYNKRDISLALQLGFSIKEIARIFGLNENSLSGLMHRWGNKEKVKGMFEIDEKEKKAFTDKYGLPQGKKIRGFLKERVVRNAQTKRDERKPEKGNRANIVDEQSKVNMKAKESGRESAISGYIKKIKNEAEKILTNSEMKTEVETKFMHLIEMLRVFTKEETGSRKKEAVFRFKNSLRTEHGRDMSSGITITDEPSVSRKPIATYPPEMTPTLRINIEIQNTLSPQEKEIQKSLWYKILQEFEVIRSGKYSPLSEFFKLNNDGIPENRLCLTFKETVTFLPSRVRGNRYQDLIYEIFIPSQTEDPFYVEHSSE